MRPSPPDEDKVAAVTSSPPSPLPSPSPSPSPPHRTYRPPLKSDRCNDDDDDDERLAVAFSHVHLYVDSVSDLATYKQFERRLNDLSLKIERWNDCHDDKEQDGKESNGRGKNEKGECYYHLDVARYQRFWTELSSSSCWSFSVPRERSVKTSSVFGATKDRCENDNDGNEKNEKGDEKKGEKEHSEEEMPFVTQNRDVVKQLLAGFGFRVTACRYERMNGTRSVLVTSRDPKGVQIVVTAKSSTDNDEEEGQQQLQQQQREGERYDGNKDEAKQDRYWHFDAANLDTFFKSHANRQGIAILSFEITSGSINTVHSKYCTMHPELIPAEYVAGPRIYRTNDDVADASDVHSSETEVMEVFAYYRGEKGSSEADIGTRLRFVQVRKQPRVGVTSRKNALSAARVKEGITYRTECQVACILPGLEPVNAVFDGTSKAAYCDHWVSNVVSRTGFLKTLRETLGFTPKVDFNAGVVAAGEAQIESTVTGNDVPTLPPLAVKESREDTDENGGTVDDALRDQRQVYLPINNALSEVGHVHGFLREIGQGVQHVASRVDDLVSFVQRGNDYRRITGEGFTFLRIPRSYYGVLDVGMLVRGIPNIVVASIGGGTNGENLDDDNDDDQEGGNGTKRFPLLSPPCAEAVFETLERCGIVATAEGGAVDLDATEGTIGKVLDKHLSAEFREEYMSRREGVIQTVSMSRYVNLYRLLRQHLSEESYLGIVRNQILVDVQGEDLLFQIFTCNILQRNASEEAPFFEFIQRVCSECEGPDNCPLPIKPGCGGFGIRNFLTLFLSIEVSKAMSELSRARAENNESARSHAQRRVDIFTQQLNESNPILTEISDAMTEEGKAEAAMLDARSRGDAEKAEMWRMAMEEAGRAKVAGNEKLMACSAKYNDLMKELRESRKQ